MKHDVCPLCAQRRARRSYPALARTICPVCCGTKRRIEIQCPDDCSYLIGARTHPPAVLQRQQQRDAHILGGMIRELSETQYRVLMLLQSTILHYRASAVPSLLDVDVADAAQALAATLESSDRGIIYEPADIIARPTARHCPRGRPREVGEGRRASGRIARRQSRYGGSRPPHGGTRTPKPVVARQRIST